MDNELQMKLVEKYPTVFKEYGGDMRRTCMAWGIACGNGWYDILDDLCSYLEIHGIVAAQVKEKFGGLRFYTNPIEDENVSWEEVHKHINKAEEKSYKTCEKCGKPGKTRSCGWVTTRCDECKAV